MVGSSGAPWNMLAGGNKLEWQTEAETWLASLLQSSSACIHIQALSLLQSSTTGAMLQKGKCPFIDHVQFRLRKQLPSPWSFWCIHSSHIASGRQCVCEGCFRLSSPATQGWRSCPSFNLISVQRHVTLQSKPWSLGWLVSETVHPSVLPHDCELEKILQTVS